MGLNPGTQILQSGSRPTIHYLKPMGLNPQTNFCISGFGFCSISKGWSHDYGKSGTYSKVCETLVHIPVDFVSTQLKWTFIWVWQNQLVYVPRFHILWYVPLSPKFLAENNFLPTYNSWVCRNWGLQPSIGETRAFSYGHNLKFKHFLTPIIVLNIYCCWYVNRPKLELFQTILKSCQTFKDLKQL